MRLDKRESKIKTTRLTDETTSFIVSTLITLNENK
jgi:hypothetical protein